VHLLAGNLLFELAVGTPGPKDPAHAIGTKQSDQNVLTELTAPGIAGASADRLAENKHKGATGTTQGRSRQPELNTVYGRRLDVLSSAWASLLHPLVSGRNREDFALTESDGHRLLVTQRGHGVYGRRTPRRNQAGRCGRAGQKQHHRYQDQRVAGSLLPPGGHQLC
jgi:hypothetical protein